MLISYASRLFRRAPWLACKRNAVSERAQSNPFPSSSVIKMNGRTSREIKNFRYPLNSPTTVSVGLLGSNSPAWQLHNSDRDNLGHGHGFGARQPQLSTGAPYAGRPNLFHDWGKIGRLRGGAHPDNLAASTLIGRVTRCFGMGFLPSGYAKSMASHRASRKLGDTLAVPEPSGPPRRRPHGRARLARREARSH